ncbi:MAG: DNA-binding domain-containing protein [Pseudomonadota bacterium]
MLHEFQRQFFQGVFGQDETIVSRLLASDRLSAGECLAIYRGSVLGIHSTALSEIYPVCKRLVGTRFFEAMCRRYIPQHPASSPNLQDYGESLAGFITEFEPARGLLYLSDVARLEWAWHRAFHAADETGTGFDISAIGRLTEAQRSQLLFNLPISGRLLLSAYPIHRIWESNQTEYEGDASIDLQAGGVKLLVWRNGYSMRIDILENDQWTLLGALARGIPLGGLAQAIDPVDITVLLPQCLQRGWITGFRLVDE